MIPTGPEAACVMKPILYKGLQICMTEQGNFLIPPHTPIDISRKLWDKGRGPFALLQMQTQQVTPGRLFYNPAIAASPPATAAGTATAAHCGSCQALSVMSMGASKTLMVLTLSFNNSDRSQFNGLLADPSIMAGVYDICHILI